jgi:hypothetical protein
MELAIIFHFLNSDDPQMNRRFLNPIHLPLRIHHRRIKSGCNSRRKTIQIAAAFAPNSCTPTMIPLSSLKELRICVGCVAGMEFMPIVGRKNHWPTGDRWTTTPDFKAATDARCAMPTPPRFRNWAKLLNR